MTQIKQVEIGIITGAHGIKGQVTVFSHTTPPEAIADLDSLVSASGKSFRLKITGHKKNVLIASVEGIADRNAAELLKGTKLFASADASGLPVKSTLPGLTAYTQDGKAYGTIVQVHNFGAGDVVEIEKLDANTEMLPLNDSFVQIKGDAVTVTPPEYLEADNGSA